jgi:hypothetical protein
MLNLWAATPTRQAIVDALRDAPGELLAGQTGTSRQVTGQDEPHPYAGRYHPPPGPSRVVSLAVPSTCPKQQSAMVAHGQPRSLAEVAGLGHRWMASSPTVLPKLAVR